LRINTVYALEIGLMQLCMDIQGSGLEQSCHVSAALCY